MKSFQILQEKIKGPETTIKTVYKKLRATKAFKFYKKKKIRALKLQLK